MLKPVQRISGDARRLKSLNELLLELLSNGAAKFLPFLQCRGQKLKIIGHQGLHAPELRWRAPDGDFCQRKIIDCSTIA